MNGRQNVGERHNHLLAPSGNERLILASFRFSNTAVQRLLVQQPVQQRRRTSAIKQSTQRTEQNRAVSSTRKTRVNISEQRMSSPPFGMSSISFEPSQNSSKDTSCLRRFYCYLCTATVQQWLQQLCWLHVISVSKRALRKHLATSLTPSRFPWRREVSRCMYLLIYKKGIT